MRGVRALWKAPLVLMLALLATCDFSLKLEQPAIELGIETAFISGNTLNISYKFVTDEPVLRCRYSVTEGSEEVLSGVSGLLAPGVQYDEAIVLPETCDDGRYSLDLVGQVRRSGDFVDMASLSQTVEFSIDTTAPSSPWVGITDGYRYAHTDSVLLNHNEWTEPAGSPVELRYTFDSMSPLDVSGGPGGILIPFPTEVGNSLAHTLQVVAVDELGHQSDQTNIGFSIVRMTSVNNVNGNLGDTGYIGYYAILDVSGFGFEPTDVVELYDSAGIKAQIRPGTSIEPSLIQVEFYLDASNHVEGEGYLKLTISGPNPTTTTLPFTFLLP